MKQIQEFSNKLHVKKYTHTHTHTHTHIYTSYTMCKYMDEPQKYTVILKKKKNIKISKLYDFIYVNFNTGMY